MADKLKLYQHLLLHFILTKVILYGKPASCMFFSASGQHVAQTLVMPEQQVQLQNLAPSMYFWRIASGLAGKGVVEHPSTNTKY